MHGKKQGGLQQVFVKFSLGLKGQQGPFLCKTRKKGKQSCVWRSWKVSLFINSSETNRKEPSDDKVPASPFLGVPERVQPDHLQGTALQAEETPAKLERQNLYPQCS